LNIVTLIVILTIMYATIHQYKVNPIFEHDFVRVWQRMRLQLRNHNLIHYGVLHKESKISYLAYYHWYSREVLDHFLQQPPPGFTSDLQKLDECCNQNKILHRMQVLTDSEQPV